MKHARREHWLQRYDQAAVGQDPEKFLQLITEINACPKERKEPLTSASNASGQARFLIDAADRNLE